MLVGEVRCATRRDRVLLEVVRRQPVVVRADEGLEERPGPARELAQEARLLGGQLRLAARQRSADPPGDRRARRATAAGSAPPRRQRARARERQQARGVATATTGADPHRPDAAPPSARRAHAARPVVRDGSPFEQPPVRDEHAPERCAAIASRLIDGLVRQERERQADLRRVPAAVAERGDQVLPQRHVVGLAQRDRAAGRDAGGRARTPSTDQRSRATACASTVQPTSSSSSSATGTRLRRRLSKIFHCDSAESGFAHASRAGGPGPAAAATPAICQSPRIQRCRRAMSAR